ncbi:hypothetical protein DF268_33370 [Streptomyces sp. V2]|nr:hypothetical protein DF268_33370 [Streptomyces sp. V2]
MCVLACDGKFGAPPFGQGRTGANETRTETGVLDFQLQSKVTYWRLALDRAAIVLAPEAFMRIRANSILTSKR